MNIRLIGPAILSLLLTALPTWSQTRTPGITETEVVFGITTPLSGPAAAWGATGLGAEAWAKHMNEQGGIQGRKVRVIVKDDAYTPGKALGNLNEMKDQVFAVVGLLGTAVVSAGKDVLIENGIPLIQAYADVQIWTRIPKAHLRSIFVNYPDYADEGEFLVTYAAQSAGARKVSVFYQNDGYGKWELEGIRRGVKALGGKAQIVAEVPYEVAERELGSQALRLKESGADTVILVTTPTHGSIIVKGMTAAGYRPRIMSGFPLGSYVMFRLLGDLWDGVYVTTNGSLVGQDPEADRIASILTKYEPRLRGGGEQFGLLGAQQMMLAIEGLRRAGRDLSREKYIKAVETVANWVPEAGGVSQTYGPNRRHGSNAVRLLRAEKGKYVPVTGYQQFAPLF